MRLLHVHREHHRLLSLHFVVIARGREGGGGGGGVLTVLYRNYTFMIKVKQDLCFTEQRLS